MLRGAAAAARDGHGSGSYPAQAGRPRLGRACKGPQAMAQAGGGRVLHPALKSVSGSGCHSGAAEAARTGALHARHAGRMGGTRRQQHSQRYLTLYKLLGQATRLIICVPVAHAFSCMCFVLRHRRFSINRTEPNRTVPVGLPDITNNAIVP